MARDITPSADIIDIRDIIERVEELRGQRKHVYVAGWNMPGYMPDSEPAEFDDADSARSYIADSMREEADDEQPDDEQPDGADLQEVSRLRELCQELRDAADSLELETGEEGAAEFDRTIGRFHYFISHQGIGGLDSDESEELETLESWLEELCGNGGDEQWEGNWYPLTLVRDSYFTEYAQQLADDIGAVNSDATWPNNCIDWDRAARELQMDYSAVEYAGVTYWYR